MTIAGLLPTTGSGWDNYVYQTLGEMDLPAGDQVVSFMSSKEPGSREKYVMNLRLVKIELVE